MLSRCTTEKEVINLNTGIPGWRDVKHLGFYKA